MLTRLFDRLRDESGQTMMMVVILAAALAFSGTMLEQAVQTDQSQSATANTRQLAFAAAEAGLDDYIAKLLDDNEYYLHYVAPGESTRQSTTGVNVAPVAPPASPTPWPSAYGTSWTYPNGKDNWVDLGNGYSYNVEITAPKTGTNATNYLDIVASGKKNGTTASYSTERVVEELLNPSSVADFQMLADASISYGSGATTKGKIYAGVDPNNPNNKYDVNHDGTAYGNIYAEGSVTGSTTLMNGATKYSGAAGTIRAQIKTPIQFTNFSGKFTDIKRAAQNANGIYLDTSYPVWWLTFDSNGTVDIKGCSLNNGQAAQMATPTSCGTSVNKALPQNGAIYAETTVVISGGTSICGGTDVPPLTSQITGSCVHGRVTVASNQDIVIGDDIDYVTPGQDTLGLMAAGYMYVAKWAPNNISWRAATLAQTGQWESATSDGSHGTMTFTGSTAALNGGQMSEFNTRVYQYDPTLQYLQPPWFPTLTNNYTVELFRELPAS
ncbi:MAG TPA: hypothetical protein VFA97_08940 [Gaiellaceae bacterium]|nr:hypothetical protein [Gaiellaceae bacterium]